MSIGRAGVTKNEQDGSVAANVATEELEAAKEVVVRPARLPSPTGDLKIKLLGTVGGSQFSARFKIAPDISELGRLLMSRRKVATQQKP